LRSKTATVAPAGGTRYERCASSAGMKSLRHLVQLRPGFADRPSKACNWPPLARQDVKERESSDDGGAGRMTATARADIGARFEARPKSVGLGLRTDV